MRCFLSLQYGEWNLAKLIIKKDLIVRIGKRIWICLRFRIGVGFNSKSSQGGSRLSCCNSKSLIKVLLVDFSHIFYTHFANIPYINHNGNFIRIQRRLPYKNIGKESYILTLLTVWQSNYALIVGRRLKNWSFFFFR